MLTLAYVLKHMKISKDMRQVALNRVTLVDYVGRKFGGRWKTGARAPIPLSDFVDHVSECKGNLKESPPT